LIEKLNSSVGSVLKVVAVENNYFGGDVSVAGLLSGSDLLSARKEVEGEFIVIPRQMLKSDEAILLDGMTFDLLQKKMGLPVHAVNITQFENLLTQRS
jgi:NifB/MoaA-like Fe-S oxidoreductase